MGDEGEGGGGEMERGERWRGGRDGEGGEMERGERWRGVRMRELTYSS